MFWVHFHLKVYFFKAACVWISLMLLSSSSQDICPPHNIFDSYRCSSCRRIIIGLPCCLYDGVHWTKLQSSNREWKQNHYWFLHQLLVFNFQLLCWSAATAENATEIYRRWLFNVDNKRPKPIELDEQQFFRVIFYFSFSWQKFSTLIFVRIVQNCFRHFSLLFNPKLSQVAGNVEATVDVHAKLCSAVLLILKQLNIEVGKLHACPLITCTHILL